MESKLIHRKWFLYLTEFFAGMSVMAVELGASRLMAPYFSSSQIVWTVIIGVIMIAMAIGNVWGGKLADQAKSPDPLRGPLAHRRRQPASRRLRDQELPGLGSPGRLPSDLRLPLRPPRHGDPLPHPLYRGQPG